MGLYAFLRELPLKIAPNQEGRPLPVLGPTLIAPEPVVPGCPAVLVVFPGPPLPLEGIDTLPAPRGGVQAARKTLVAAVTEVLVHVIDPDVADRSAFAPRGGGAGDAEGVKSFRLLNISDA